MFGRKKNIYKPTYAPTKYLDLTVRNLRWIQMKNVYSRNLITRLADPQWQLVG